MMGRMSLAVVLAWGAFALQAEPVELESNLIATVALII